MNKTVERVVALATLNNIKLTGEDYIRILEMYGSKKEGN